MLRFLRRHTGSITLRIFGFEVHLPNAQARDKRVKRQPLVPPFGTLDLDRQTRTGRRSERLGLEHVPVQVSSLRHDQAMTNENGLHEIEANFVSSLNLLGANGLVKDSRNMQVGRKLSGGRRGLDLREQRRAQKQQGRKR